VNAEIITSSSNITLKRARKARNHVQDCLAEGPKLIHEALDAGLQVDALLIDQAASEAHAGTIERAIRAGARALNLASNLFSSLSPTVSNQGILAICQQPAQLPLDQVLSEPGAKIILCDAIQDPGNLGAIVRTALGMGVSAVSMLPGCANPFADKVIRGSAGAVFHQPLCLTSAEQVSQLCQNKQITLIGLDAGAETPLKRMQAASPVALVLGNEGHGFSREVGQLISIWQRIPLNPRSESLNVAVAAGIAMYELFGNRGDR